MKLALGKVYAFISLWRKSSQFLANINLRIRRVIPLTIIDEIGSVIDVLAAPGVFHGDLDKLLHRWIVSMVMVFVGIQHVLWDAHLSDRL